MGYTIRHITSKRPEVEPAPQPRVQPDINNMPVYYWAQRMEERITKLEERIEELENKNISLTL